MGRGEAYFSLTMHLLVVVFFFFISYRLIHYYRHQLESLHLFQWAPEYLDQLTGQSEKQLLQKGHYKDLSH